MKIEIVVYNIDSAIKAQEGGADRIELCDNPAEGGTTPSLGLIQTTIQLLRIPVFVMIRPRGGDFCYSDYEFECMKRDIEVCKSLQIPGVVFGILKPEGTLDKARCKTLIELAKPMEVTCHRAFDMTQHPLQTLEDCIELGFTRILSSGHQSKAEKGIDLLKQLVKEAKDRIIIMPGSGINEKNAFHIISTTKANEIHFSAAVEVKSTMQFENKDITGMGSAAGAEFMLRSVDPEQIKKIRTLVGE